MSISTKVEPVTTRFFPHTEDERAWMRQVAESAATLALRGGSVPVSAIVDQLVPPVEAETIVATEEANYRLSGDESYVQRCLRGHALYQNWLPVALLDKLTTSLLPQRTITDEVVEAAARAHWGCFHLQAWETLNTPGRVRELQGARAALSAAFAHIRRRSDEPGFAAALAPRLRLPYTVRDRYGATHGQYFTMPDAQAVSTAKDQAFPDAAPHLVEYLRHESKDTTGGGR